MMKAPWVLILFKVGYTDLQGLGFTTNNAPIFYKHLSRRLIADIIVM